MLNFGLNFLEASISLMKPVNNIYILLTCMAIALCFASCKSSKKVVTDDIYIPSEDVKKDKSSCWWANYGIVLKEGEYNEALYREIGEWMGVKYKYGGNTKDGTDCSGLVTQLYLAVYDRKLQRNSARIFEKDCKEIKKNQLKEGDLVFFSSSNKKSRINHVGLYLIEGKFVHAGSKGVVIDSLSAPYYNKHHVASGRVK